MDVLSEILSAVRLEGALFFNAEFSAPWCLSSSGAVGIEPYLPSKGAHLVMFHFLTEGKAYAALPGGERVELNEGDIVVLPHGEPHILGNGFPQIPVDSFKTFAKNLSDGLKCPRENALCHFAPTTRSSFRDFLVGGVCRLGCPPGVQPGDVVGQCG